ncbi:hypothetical protein T07_8144 [Trichinella nelsoni]|uniref:Uncharacterized protein n=1 Tax=Trichinella nelsoni TaxID=6336 RepID=A0A0V0RP07_9BILA|nr:hypothetical protein T07_8144 [Trichinella nelsoni]
MDYDLYLRLTRSGRIIQELTVLPDADISEPEMDSDDDQRSSSVVESSAELTSEDEETYSFRRAEFRDLVERKCICGSYSKIAFVTQVDLFDGMTRECEVCQKIFRLLIVREHA